MDDVFYNSTFVSVTDRVKQTNALAETLTITPF